MEEKKHEKIVKETLTAYDTWLSNMDIFNDLQSEYPLYLEPLTTPEIGEALRLLMSSGRISMNNRRGVKLYHIGPEPPLYKKHTGECIMCEKPFKSLKVRGQCDSCTAHHYEIFKNIDTSKIKWGPVGIVDPDDYDDIVGRI